MQGNEEIEVNLKGINALNPEVRQIILDTGFPEHQNSQLKDLATDDERDLHTYLALINAFLKNSLFTIEYSLAIKSKTQINIQNLISLLDVKTLDGLSNHLIIAYESHLTDEHIRDININALQSKALNRLVVSSYATLTDKQRHNIDFTKLTFSAIQVLILSWKSTISDKQLQQVAAVLLKPEVTQQDQKLLMNLDDPQRQKIDIKKLQDKGLKIDTLLKLQPYNITDVQIQQINIKKLHDVKFLLNLPQSINLTFLQVLDLNIADKTTYIINTLIYTFNCSYYNFKIQASTDRFFILYSPQDEKQIDEDNTPAKRFERFKESINKTALHFLDDKVLQSIFGHIYDYYKDANLLNASPYCKFETDHTQFHQKSEIIKNCIKILDDMKSQEEVKEDGQIDSSSIEKPEAIKKLRLKNIMTQIKSRKEKSKEENKSSHSFISFVNQSQSQTESKSPKRF